MEKNYIHIDNWMINGLGLNTKNELLIYAVIYSFSENTNNQGYYGSLDTLSKRVASSRTRVCEVLKKLCDKKLIVKQDVYKNNVKYCLYRVNPEYKVVVGDCNE